MPGPVHNIELPRGSYQANSGRSRDSDKPGPPLQSLSAPDSTIGKKAQVKVKDWSTHQENAHKSHQSTKQTESGYMFLRDPTGDG